MSNDKLFVIIGGLMVAPFLIPMVIPDPYATITILGMMVASLFWLRKYMRNIASNFLQSKMIWVCSVCQKPHNQTECPRCGSRQRKML